MMRLNRRLTGPDKELYRIGLFIPVLALIIVILYHLFAEKYSIITICVFDRFLGIYCPGCGGTRAVKAFFKGQLLKSFLYHPFVPYCIFGYLIYMIQNTLYLYGIGRVKQFSFRYKYVWIGVLIIIVNVIIKNILRLGFQIFMH